MLPKDGVPVHVLMDPELHTGILDQSIPPKRVVPIFPLGVLG